MPEKYESKIRPVFCLIKSVLPSSFNLSQYDDVLLSCHTIALYIGAPVFLFHTTVVSLWLVIPTAAISFDEIPEFLTHSLRTADCVSNISLGLCSTQPSCGKI